ncbi:hypothetical protein G7054_g12267 [Neopestalotiopsis clavispora]|nr:hypothetical protein G7054_g12267 [Neopestalotiopsis clavispora]
MSTAIPSDSSAADHGDHSKESDTHEAPGSPLTGVAVDEDESTTSQSDGQDLHERLREMESKMAAVDKLYDLHQSTAKVMDFSNQDLHGIPWSAPGRIPGGHRERLEFYSDIVFFMRKLRDTHQKIAETERRQVGMRPPYIPTDASAIYDRMEKIGLESFANGERVKLIQLEWEEYLSNDVPVEDTFMTPIEILSGEPDTKVILQHGAGTRNFKKTPAAQSQVERILPNMGRGNFSEQQPLPERIRMRSDTLFLIFREVNTPGNDISSSWFNGRPEVYLRPYQDFYYLEQRLRDWLAMLEKRFENHNIANSHVRPLKPATNGACTEQDDTKSRNERLSSDKDDRPETEKHLDELRAAGSGSDSLSPGKDLGETATKDKPQKEEKLNEKFSHSIMALIHLRALMEFIDKELKPKHDFIRSPRCTSVYFHDLWHLFRPGDVVIQQDGKQAFVVLRVQVPRHRIEEPYSRWHRAFADDASDSEVGSDKGEDDDDDDDNDDPFRLHCVYIDFDGKSFGPVSRKFKILPFDEAKLIKALPVYPLRCIEGTQARQDLIDRGRRLLKVSKFKDMYYTGVTLDRRDEIDSQVVIDFNEFLADGDRRDEWEPSIGNPNTSADHLGLVCTAACCRHEDINDGSEIDDRLTENYIKSLFPDTSMGAPSLILQSRSLEDVLSSSSRLTETELLIMTYRVFGFVLRSRKWAQLDLSLLRDEDENARTVTVNAFDRLELPKNHREVLKSLVVQHFRSKQSTFMKDEQTDLIQGKGKGLILLLHGAPGVGKTTTAGDLGTTAREVEEELEKNFSLASRWGCVLLLDEADVFLSAREKTDFTRNGLVAVFLRVLEYYSGILFLTTNRIGDFDEAFSSRIHMSLYYPPLDEESTWKVFKLNLDLIEERFVVQGRSVIFDRSAVEKFAREHYRDHVYKRWNGRQIRNACQTALALADFDSQGGSLDIDSEINKNAVVQLQLKYFETVQKAYLAFDEYLGDIQGGQGDSRAIDYKLRGRKDTPYQHRPNAFLHHENSGSNRSQRNVYPEYPHAQRSSSNMSESNFGSHGDQFSQNYSQATPSANMSRSQGHESYQSNVYQGQSRGGPMVNREFYDRSSEGPQQFQTDNRYFQGGSRGQHFDSPQASNRVIPGVEDERYSDPSHDGSPLPRRVAQRQSQAHGFDNPNDGGIAQTLNQPMPGPSSYNPNSIFRS